MYQDQTNFFQAYCGILKISKVALRRVGEYLYSHTGSEVKLDIRRTYLRISNEKGFAVESLGDPLDLIKDGVDALVEMGIWKREGGRVYRDKRNGDT
jgi:hypothetical protein